MPKTTSDVTAVTATGDTTETSIGTVTLPPNATKILGVACYAIAGGGLTTLETASGIFRVKVNGIDVSPANFILDVVGALTSGAFAYSPRIYAVNGWEPVANAKVEFFVTMDMALTIASKARGQVLYEVS